MTKKFSHNLVINTKAASKEPSADMNKNYHKYRYYNIYKNLLRDMKIYYKRTYNDRVSSFEAEAEAGAGVKCTYTLNKIMFPLNIFHFL